MTKIFPGQFEWSGDKIFGKLTKFFPLVRQNERTILALFCKPNILWLVLTIIQCTVFPQSESEYIFPCNRWLSKTEDDGALSRELVAVDKQEFERRRQRSLQRKQSLKRSSSVAGDNIDLEQKGE